MQLSRLVIAMLSVPTWAHAALAEVDVEKLIAESNPAIQSQINTTANAFLNGKRSKTDVKTNWVGFRELAKLKELASSEEQLIKQLAIFAALEEDEEEQQVPKAVLVLQLLELKPQIPIRALAPYLGSDNPKLREFAQSWCQVHDNAGYDSPLSPVNYDDYAQYVGQSLSRNLDVPEAFAEFIFARAPERALLVYYRGDRARYAVPRLEAISRNLRSAKKQGAVGGVELPQVPGDDREVLLGAHFVENAIWLKRNKFEEQFNTALPEATAQLAKLAEHDQWWVRLYVAEIMRRNPELRQPQVLQKLRDDDNTSVCKAVKLVRE